MATEKSDWAWICPMCPGVGADEPGVCPKCGMALERAVPSEEEEENPELASMRTRLWLGVALTIPVLVLAMSGMFAQTELLEKPFSSWVEGALATAVVLWCGLPFFERALASLRGFHLNMFSLIGLGVGAAWGFSVVALVAPELFPDALRDAHGEIPVYFESAATIVCLVLVGQVLELRARSRTGEAVRSLLDLAPQTARRLIEGDVEETVPIGHVHVGDRLRVVPGARVPVDGVVLTGESNVDESMVTGEPMPKHKREGDRLFGSTINGQGSLVMAAERVGDDTLLSHIVQMVSDAQRSRAPIQRLADSVAAVFVPAVVLVAVVAFVAWLFLGPPPAFAHAIVAAVSVLIVACPCALGLATPMSIMVAAGRGAQAGVLFRHAEAIELLRKVDTLVVDKTGTLTEGRPSLETLVTAPGFDSEQLVGYSASLERSSEHPIARALVEGAAARSVDLAEPERFEALAGRGVRGSVGGHEVALGNLSMLEELGIDPGALGRNGDALREEGQTVVFAAVDGRFAGLLGIADRIKPGSHEAVTALHADGIRVLMLTGDAQTTARTVGGILEIDEVIAEVLPEQKAEIVERLRAEGHVVAMAGDGVNDAPALAAADVGIAMGPGSDVAIESAAITLVEGDLRSVVRARALSRATVRNVRQNLFFAFVYNSLGVPVAAGVLYPLLGVLLSPMLAAAAMSLSSVSVISNALRLRNAKLGGVGGAGDTSLPQPA